jgi:hypothetical protein
MYNTYKNNRDNRENKRTPKSPLAFCYSSAVPSGPPLCKLHDRSGIMHEFFWAVRCQADMVFISIPDWHGFRVARFAVPGNEPPEIRPKTLAEPESCDLVAANVLIPAIFFAHPKYIHFNLPPYYFTPRVIPVASLTSYSISHVMHKHK